MQKTEYEFYNKLKINSFVHSKSVPKSIKNSQEFQSLVRSKVLGDEKSGRGRNYTINKPEHYADFIARTFPAGDIEVKNEIDNQRKYRNTKATTVEKERAVFLRGSCSILLNNEEVNLSFYTTKFGLFSGILNSLHVKKLCFVENFTSFLQAEKLLGNEYVYIHFYGRFPKNTILKKIVCDEYLHFGDYDFVGLQEYLRAKSAFKNATIYIPDNLDELFKKYATKRKAKDTMYKNVKNTTEADVIHIREMILTSGDFLEQQILMDNIND